MTAEPIAISPAARSVLLELAARTGRAAADVLDAALEEYRRKVFLDEVNTGYAALRADPSAWAEVESERRSMDGCNLDGLNPTERWTETGEPLPSGGTKADG